MPSPPWKVSSGLEPVVQGWLASGTIRPCFTADHELEATAGRFAPLPPSLHPALAAALGKQGIHSLYDHQVRAFEAAKAGKHVVVATPTASGKSLCFHLPVLDALCREPDASAIYLYPTKALSRDQESSLRDLIAEAGLASTEPGGADGISAIVYDGDTPGDARRAARQRTSIVMTNPDMLHAGILPHHANWARTLQKLRYVVVDELHTYRGVFGSHVAHVLHRLQRAARFHGSEVTFICATATIGNPLEHASRLLGVDPSRVELCDESGAPRGARRFFLYNPPVVNRELGIRASYLKSAVRLAADLVRARVPTIVFGASRNSVEVMLKYLRAELAEDLRGQEETAVMAYRGGYLPETRRHVERGLKSGQIRCVVATNALELGIDIGDLDAVVCAGYPGSVAETWQRFGRAGRRGSQSVALLVASSNPLDQFVAHAPAHLLEGASEQARIDPGNTEILVQHLKCAAFELPFVGGEPFSVLDADETREALRFLASHGVVHEAGDQFHWATDAYPANNVSLRNVGWDNYVIIDKATGRAMAELDWRATPTMLHEQAIYQHDGEQYQVEQLDYENHKAFVRKVVPDYFTTAMSHRKVSVLSVSDERRSGRARVAWGEVSVVTKVVGYKKIRFFTHENAGYGDVMLPEIQMHTTSFWWSVDESVAAELGRAAVVEGVRGIAHALETMATFALMCDPRDIGHTLGQQSPAGAADAEGAEEPAGREIAAVPEGSLVPRDGFDPTIFLFDAIPGGVGLAERIYERVEELLRGAQRLVSECECERGCPLCVGASAPEPTTMPLPRKRAALAILHAVGEGVTGPSARGEPAGGLSSSLAHPAA